MSVRIYHAASILVMALVHGAVELSVAPGLST